MIKFKNGWKSHAKQNDRYIIEIRFGKCSLLELYFDFSSRKFAIGLCNFSIRN